MFKRALVSNIFEILVPVLLVFVGLCFTKIEFIIDTPPRQISPLLYPSKMRLFHNNDLIIKDGKYTNPIQDGEEDFDDHSNHQSPNSNDI